MLISLDQQLSEAGSLLYHPVVFSKYFFQSLQHLDVPFPTVKLERCVAAAGDRAMRIQKSVAVHGGQPIPRALNPTSLCQERESIATVSLTEALAHFGPEQVVDGPQGEDCSWDLPQEDQTQASCERSQGHIKTGQNGWNVSLPYHFQGELEACRLFRDILQRNDSQWPLEECIVAFGITIRNTEPLNGH